MKRQKKHDSIRHAPFIAGAVLAGTLLASCGESSDAGDSAVSARSNATLEEARVALEAGDAAPTYRWAHAQFDDAQFELFKAATRKGGGGGGGNGVDAEARAELAKASVTIDWLIAAANAPRGGFGIETSLGMETLLPHLGQMRSLTNLLIADANRLSGDGQHEEAVKRVIAVVRMAEQMSREAVVTIEWLVTVAMTEYALRGADNILDPGVPQGVRDDLLSVFSTISQRDPMKGTDILRNEGMVMGYSIREGLLGDELEIAPGTDAVALALSVEQLYEQMVHALRTPGFEAQFLVILAAPSNVEATRFLPDFTRHRQAPRRFLEHLSETKARLK